MLEFTVLPGKREGKFHCVKVAFQCWLATNPVYQASGMYLTPEMAFCIQGLFLRKLGLFFSLPPPLYHPKVLFRLDFSCRGLGDEGKMLEAISGGSWGQLLQLEA